MNFVLSELFTKSEDLVNSLVDLFSSLFKDFDKIMLNIFALENLVKNTSPCFRCFRKDAKNKELLFVGRICIVVLVAISIAWIPIIQQMQGHKLDSTKLNGSINADSAFNFSSKFKSHIDALRIN